VPHSHLLLLLVFSALVSAVFAVLMRDTPQARWRFALYAFAGFTLCAILAGWLMYPFPA
jgi:hypothetical protein